MFRSVTSLSSNIFCVGYLEHQSVQRCTPIPKSCMWPPVSSLLLLHEISTEGKPAPVSWMGNTEPGSCWVLFLEHFPAHCVVLASSSRLQFSQASQLFAPGETLSIPLSSGRNRINAFMLGLNFLFPSDLVPMCCACPIPRMERSEGAWKRGVSIWASHCSL